MPGTFTLEGPPVPCSICDREITAPVAESGGALAVAGLRIYVACTEHFYWRNPATGELTEKPEFDENHKLLGLKYAVGEGLTERNQG